MSITRKQIADALLEFSPISGTFPVGDCDSCGWNILSERGYEESSNAAFWHLQTDSRAFPAAYGGADKVADMLVSVPAEELFVRLDDARRSDADVLEAELPLQWDGSAQQLELFLWRAQLPYRKEVSTHSDGDNESDVVSFTLLPA